MAQAGFLRGFLGFFGALVKKPISIARAVVPQRAPAVSGAPVQGVDFDLGSVEDPGTIWTRTPGHMERQVFPRSPERDMNPLRRSLRAEMEGDSDVSEEEAAVHAGAIARSDRAVAYTERLQAATGKSTESQVGSLAAVKVVQQIPIIGQIPGVSSVAGAIGDFIGGALGPGSVPVIDPVTKLPFQLTPAERQAIADDQRPYILARKLGTDPSDRSDFEPL